jgi:hypothetical protein
MTFTLLEGAIALLLVAIALRIGFLIAPWLLRRRRGRSSDNSPDHKNKPPYTIDI